MIPRRITRAALGTTLLGIAVFIAVGQVTVVRSVAAAGSTVTAASRHGPASGISLQIAVGYQNIYRGTSWTPVRVTLHNNSGANIDGLLRIPQSNESSSVGASPAFHGLYQSPVTLPAGGTKRITVYVPGSGIQSRVDASFQQGGRVLATASAFPIGIDSGALLIGVLASSPGDFAWVAPAIQQHVTTHVVPLSTATLDPVAQALGTFDIIVLTNADTSQLDAAQRSALEGFVRAGGSLLLVGGPSWQQTLRPLPAALLPGTLVGTRVLPNLHGLRSLGTLPPGLGRESAAVSVLANPQGTVRAGQGGIPLVVRSEQGQGTIDYLAFDPALTSLPPGSPVLEHLVAMAAPLAITRTWSPGGFRQRFQTIFHSVALTGELANVPPATLPLLAVFAALTLGYVLILGPANFLLLRRLGRQHLAWITLPALAFVYLGSMPGVAAHFKDSTALVNTISVITLGNHSGMQPATTYLSLAVPLPGTYTLASSSGALPAPLPQVNAPDGFSFRDASTLHSTPLGMQLQEDPQTTMTFPGMKRWDTRDATLDTTVGVSGGVRSSLAIDSHGAIAGSIHNGTDLDLQDPVVMAGPSIAHISAIPAGATVHVYIPASGDASGQDPTTIWDSLYGGASQSSDGYGGFGFGDCCNQFSFPTETRLIDRVRNAMSMLSQAQTLAAPGGVMLVAWNQRALETFTVDGTMPQRRSLNLLLSPLAVRFPSRGPFRLSPGTLAAHLVDVLPRAPQSSGGFGFGGPDSRQALSVGAGGSLTFEFDLPSGRHVRFQQLTLTSGSGADSLGPADVYDWQAQRWVNIDLSQGAAQLPAPNRFVSPAGRLLVEVRATQATGDLTISDQYHAVDLSGTGRVT